MKDLKKYAPFISLILVVITIVMLFISPGLIHKTTIGSLTNKVEVDVSAFNIIFGIDDAFDFNVLGLIAVVLIVLGAVIPFLKLDDKLKHLIAAIALIAGGVLMFVFPSTIDIAIGSYIVAWPLIIAGVVSIVAGAVNLVGVLVE